MISLLAQLIMWEFILSVGRLFHSMSSWSHKSFILVHPALAMARPSLSPLILKGWLAELVTRGLLKIGCLRTFACNVGLVFILTFKQDPNMFFQNEKVVFWNLGQQIASWCIYFLGLPHGPGAEPDPRDVSIFFSRVHNRGIVLSLAIWQERFLTERWARWFLGPHSKREVWGSPILPLLEF
jgi:hypothetical protein